MRREFRWESVAAVKQGKLADGASMVLATIGVSRCPALCSAMLMMYVFCEKWEDIPLLWTDFVEALCAAGVLHGILPGGLYHSRLMRSSMLETMRQDYIRTERSKGVPEWEVLEQVCP
ncbi:MAG: hypothetical protein ACLR0U_12445 [Enterocloster clostridioformis]